MDLALPSDFKEFLNLLNVNSVEYLLIGGYAVSYHGVRVEIMNLADLKSNKLASGRARDLADLEELP